MKLANFGTNPSKKVDTSELRASESISNNAPFEKFLQLRRIGENDLSRLKSEIADEIETYFLTRQTTYLASQLTVLENAVSAVLSGEPGTVTAIPIAPGGGKSTMLRGLLTKLSSHFCDMEDSIAKHFGGVIVVVEKSSEGHELETLCNQTAGQQVATLVESANDFNLGLGLCANGTAFRFEECKRRSCPDYEECALMHISNRLHETPILIILHARYQRFMECVEKISFWEDSSGHQYPRTLLLIDELPDMFDEGAIDLHTLNEAALEIDQLKPSYQYEMRIEKQDLIYQWNRHIQSSYIRLQPKISMTHGPYGLLTQKIITEAGFKTKPLQDLKKKLCAYATDTQAERIVDILLNRNCCYFAVTHTVSIFLPRLKQLHGEGKPATFIFSGTASLSPEIANNSNVRMLDDAWKESYSRLTFYAQHGDVVSASKTGLQRSGQLQVAAAWIAHIINEMREKHKKILVVTFKIFSEPLWKLLQDWHSYLIPYIDGSGNPQPKLPYYGGVTGSNQYLEASCVICVGLNRFEPKDYLMRTLALDENRKVTTAIRKWLKNSKCSRLDQNNHVMATQDITLARDIVQLVFRSALRNHGSTIPIDCWLLQPPKGVLAALQHYFGDCVIKKVPEFPESCIRVASTVKTYGGSTTHAAKLMKWLQQWDGHAVSPDEIREATGLTQKQFKEVRRHPNVQNFFKNYVTTSGSGRHTIYQRRDKKDAA